MTGRLARLLGAGFVLLAAAGAAPPDEIRRQLLAEPESLDPQLITGSTDFDVVDDLFEGLTAQAADGSTIPGLAERWEVSEDRLAWTFHLRADLHWSDGSPLGAEDLVWSLRRAVDPRTASPYAASLLPLRGARAIIAGAAAPETLGVAAPDPRTVRIDLAERTPFLPQLMMQPVTDPLPRAAIERWGRDWTRPGHLVSDGPFTLESWVPQSEILLERNPAYHDAAATRLARVRWILAEDRQAALRQYRAGELDHTLLAAEDYAWARQNAAAELHSTPLFASRFLTVNMAHGPLVGDVRLCEALSLAIDRAILTERIDTRGQRAALGLVPPGLGRYRPQQAEHADLAPAEAHARARSLLEAAGFTRDSPLAVTLLLEHDDTDHRIAGGLRAMWESGLPLKVTLQETEWRVYNAAYHRGDFELALASWYADYADPWNFLANFRSDAGPLNPGGYRSAAFDQAMAAAQEAEGEARAASLETAERRLLDDGAVLPLEWGVSQKLVSPRVQGWAADPFDMNMSRFLGVGP